MFDKRRKNFVLSRQIVNSNTLTLVERHLLFINEKEFYNHFDSFEIKEIYNFNIDYTWIAKKNFIIQKLNNKKNLIIDARNKLRFNGTEKEPRKGLRSGHIPCSKNLFWKDLTTKGEIIISKKLIKEK